MTATTKIAVSVLILARNEHARLPALLEVCQYFTDVWVIDSNSSDDTAQLAESAGARVVNFVWNGQYPKKKQWALDVVPFLNNWILLLDADEFPEAPLRREIANVATETSIYGAYDARLDYHFTGRTLKHGYRVSKRILVRRDRVRFPEIDDLAVERMGEVEGHYQPVSDWPVGILHSSLRHDDLSPLFDWLARHNRYSDWEAYLRLHPEVAAQVRKARSRQGRVFARVPLKPLVFFGYSYLFRLGFLDGYAGFNYAFALSFYYWLIDEKAREEVRS